MKRLLLLPLLAITTMACGLFGGGQVPTAEVTAQPTQAATEGPPPTETPVPFKSDLTLCTAQAVPQSVYASSAASAGAVYDLLMPRAVRYGEDYTAEAGALLTELPTFENGGVVQNDDGTYTIRLTYRADLTWSDGEPFTLEDAQRGFFEAPSLFDVRVDVRDAVIDGDTLIITAGPDTEYPYVPNQPPVPAHIVGEGSVTELPLRSPSLGPYVLTGEDADALTFEPNPHWAGTIPFTTVTLRLLDANTAFAELEAENCDLVLDGSLGQFQVDVLDTTGVTLTAWQGQVHERVLFNTFIPEGSARVPYFADFRVRRAMALAINHTELMDAATGGLGEVYDSWLPDEHWAYTGGAPTDHNPGAARTLLTQAGWSESGGAWVYNGSGGSYACQRGTWSIEDGTPLEPALLIPADDPVRDAMADQIVSDLAAIGVTVQVERVPNEELFGESSPLLRRAFDWVLFSNLTRPDPGGVRQWVGADVYRHPTQLDVVHRWELEARWLESDQLVERLALDNTPTLFNDYTGQNYGGWCQEEANIAIVEANLPRPTPERIPFYATQQAVFAEEVPSLPLFGRSRIAAYNGYLCGVNPGPVEAITWNITQWRFDETAACE